MHAELERVLQECNELPRERAGNVTYADFTCCYDRNAVGF